ncbi:hypothetical protein DSO57_1031379 [Entomophthora muscae]|uniref:Uncharacterized protein n=1 Tax=Entomophthora muscae TaxID=34485 RepID=A0ACC2SQ37_9FUNG|nr:hypothetical protein DSO57_1031379 [Entomophthora muscae]
MKFGKYMQEEIQTLGPEWQKSVIPYKSLKKAIKHDEFDLEAYSRWQPILATGWSNKLDMLSDLYTLVDTGGGAFERDFYRLLGNSLINLRTFLDEAFQDTKNRLVSLKLKLLCATNPFYKDITIWKKILGCYKEFEVWNIQTPAQLSRLSYIKLDEQFTRFLNRIYIRKLPEKLTQKESKEALLLFLEANKQMLSLIRFCELNQTAAKKIMKKFNKSTQNQLCLAVAKQTLSPLYNYPKFTLQSWWDLINNTIPNIDDFLCPICLDIVWKPTRLDCGHVFCHWCCLQAQLRANTHCPVCRSPESMNSAQTTDLALSNHLKTYFPDEVRKKKKDQEKEIMLSQIGHLQGAEFMANLSCSIM